ncbi:winged helix-turn-helix domain-containing protein [Deinococcus cellulosilyticus]|uniref:Uncharacterized protein n=1 Tax=Deinococcus cellulosilyticus (strain DSM 18568 / NBRC 106333 / KACC 11606 / 5516J-15) TaxID=1223518 RepID=A0A511MVY2_DEIC1|nr:helix-turn-helix domain-containing protein [Deinococcus cellulosilyticus]GEM44418.1 hypothetical protein DC3_00530 [Deinococcus cellulosilyticus NBRC 106333 = KACC 11606]
MKPEFLGGSPDRWCIIEDPEQARLILRSSSSKVFEALLARERTLSDLKAELGMSLENLHYHIGKLLDHDLIEVKRTIPGPGRPLKVYSTLYQAYDIPFDLTPYEGAYEMILHQQEQVARRIARNYAAIMDEVGFRSRRIYFDEETGQVSSHGAPDPRAPQAELPESLGHDFTLDLKLSQQQATELRQELQDLMEKYRRMTLEGRPYLLSCVMCADVSGT